MKIIRDHKIKEQVSVCPQCGCKSGLTSMETGVGTLEFKELRTQVGTQVAFKLSYLFDNHNINLTKYKVSLCSCGSCGCSWQSDVYVNYAEFSQSKGHRK